MRCECLMSCSVGSEFQFFSLENDRMFLPEPAAAGGFEKCPEGNHLAVCYEVLDLGTQETNYNGETKRQRKIWVGWETPSELMEDGRPFVIGMRYTFSSHEKSTLRKHLESWRGRKFTDEEVSKFNIESVIGKGCFLNVIHAEKGDRTYANIGTVAALPKGTETPPLTNPATFLSLDPNEFDEAVFNSLSDRMKETIRQSPEFADLTKVNAGETDGDSPF